MALTKKIGLLCVVAACTSFSVLGMAANATNKVVLKNSSNSTAPITVSYIIQHDNAAGIRLPKITLKRNIVKLNPGDSKTVAFNMDNYKLAGLVPVAVGKITMHSGNAFNKPEQCAMTTDEKHPSGTLTFTATQQGTETKIQCKPSGGIFDA